ncbi:MULTISPECIES: hypothetical protein [unclassified Streptomyces]|uniref:hypothetical protein n=1 Tax=Streptomyces sp. BJ20 TaxID=2930049 RepID=UPI001FD50F1B|nr:hypothetical protein [Streptomyces sp. BJ20]
MTDRRRSARGRRERPRWTPGRPRLVVLGGLLVVRGQPGIGKSALHPFRHATLDRGLLER